MQHRSSAVRWHVSAWGGGVNREFSPRDLCVVIIESPNVAVFPGCFQSLMNVESQGYVYGNNEVGNSCLPGGKTHF